MMSAVTPPAATLPDAVRAGADLRAARERLGLSLEEVARDLRIRLPHLKALEEGRVSELPGNAFAWAFVRSYAGSLGLDVEAMVRRFRTGTTRLDSRMELDFPVPVAERGLPAGATALLGVVLAVGAYAGWYRLSGEGRLPAEAVTAVPQRLASLAEQALPLSSGPSNMIADATPRVVPDPVADLGNLADPAPPVMAISPTSAAAAQLPPRAEDPPAAAGLAPPVDATRIVLRAIADSWVMVKDRSGTILLNRILRTGETWPVPGRTDLMFTTGNAGGTEVLVDGTAIPSLGGSGVVRRDLSLDPDQIKDGKLAVGPGITPLASSRPRQ